MSDAFADIGIPVYERAGYVATAIESDLSQSYTSWQLTVSEELRPTEPVLHAAGAIPCRRPRKVCPRP